MASDWHPYRHPYWQPNWAFVEVIAASAKPFEPCERPYMSLCAIEDLHCAQECSSAAIGPSTGNT